MMKSKYVLVVTVIAAVVVIGLLAAVSANSTATAGSSDQQSISTNACPFTQSAFEEVSDGGCKKKCDPNCTNECCKKKSDPNSNKRCG